MINHGYLFIKKIKFFEKFNLIEYKENLKY